MLDAYFEEVQNSQRLEANSRYTECASVSKLRSSFNEQQENNGFGGGKHATARGSTRQHEEEVTYCFHTSLPPYERYSSYEIAL
eukprot:5355183-Pleurochrysis_carterae.AAC.1